MPTEVNCKTLGTDLSASSALLASWMVSSSTFTINNPSSGRKLVVTPVSVKVVKAMPILSVVDNPAELYVTFSPVTKKWSGIVIVSPIILTIDVSLPSNIFSKIGLKTCLIGKDLLTSLSVPVYLVKEDSSVLLLKFMLSLVSSSTRNAFIYTWTLTLIFGSGVNKISVVAAMPTPSETTLLPNVPRPLCVLTFPNSLSNVWLLNSPSIWSSTTICSRNSYLSLVVSCNWIRQ